MYRIMNIDALYWRTSAKNGQNIGLIEGVFFISQKQAETLQTMGGSLNTPFQREDAGWSCSLLCL